MTSRGFLTSFVLPMVTPQRYDKDSSGRFLKNTRVYSKSTNVQPITGNDAKLQRLENISKFLADSNEFLKLKRLLLCLIHIKTVDKFNIAIFTNLSGHIFGTGENDGNEKENLDLLKKMITNTIGSNLNRKGYNLTTYKEYVDADSNNISIPTHGRYVNFASNKNIILYGYDDIALAGKDYNGDLSDRTDNSTNITNMDFQLSLNSTTKMPTSSFSANTLGPLGSDGDFLMSLINSPFKTTIYVNKNLEIVNSRIKQMFTLLETKPIGLLAVPTNTRNFCNHSSGEFNLTKSNLGARIGAYNTNLMGLNKDHKYVLPFLEIIKQNFVMICMRWDRYFDHINTFDEFSSLNIHYGLKRTDDSLTSDTGYYKELVKTNNSNNISYKKIFYNSFLQNDEGYLKINNVGTHGFINLQGERSGNDTNRIISNLIGSYSSQSAIKVNQKIRDTPPVEWTSPQSRGYTLSSNQYNLYNDSDELYLKVNYASSGNKLGSMMYAAAFNYEGNNDTNIFDFGLWTSTNDGLVSANIDDNSTKTIFYELPFYTFVDQKEYNFSYLLYKEISEEQSSNDSTTSGFNFGDSARPWKISKSCHLLKQQIKKKGNGVVFGPSQLITNTEADLFDTFNTAGDTNAVDLISEDLNVEDPALENRDDVDNEEDQEGDGDIVTEKNETDTIEQLKNFTIQTRRSRFFTPKSKFTYSKVGVKDFAPLPVKSIPKRKGTNDRRSKGTASLNYDESTNTGIADS
jgi:hypothetical protein